MGVVHTHTHSLSLSQPLCETDDFRIFCGDLGNEVSDEGLSKAFSKYASFQKARVIKDRNTRKSKGYGFVSFKDGQDYLRALKEMNGASIHLLPLAPLQYLLSLLCFLPRPSSTYSRPKPFPSPTILCTRRTVVLHCFMVPQASTLETAPSSCEKARGKTAASREQRARRSLATECPCLPFSPSTYNCKNDTTHTHTHAHTHLTIASLCCVHCKLQLKSTST